MGMIGQLTLFLLEYCTSLLLHPILNLKIRVSKLEFFSLVYSRSNCMQFDKVSYSKLNNIAKVIVNLKSFACFPGVWSLFSLSQDPFP